MENAQLKGDKSFIEVKIIQEVRNYFAYKLKGEKSYKKYIKIDICLQID